MDTEEQGKILAWNACVIVLAGGKSGRMGSDKSMLLCDGVPLVERLVQRFAPHFQEVVLSTNQPDAHGFLGVPMIADRYPAAGPLGGIVSALEQSHYDENFVVACDILDPPLELVATLHECLHGRDAAVPRIVEPDRFEPLFGWYHKGIMGDMRRAIEAKVFKLQDFLRAHDIATVPIVPGVLINLNTPADARRHLPGTKD